LSTTRWINCDLICNSFGVRKLEKFTLAEQKKYQHLKNDRLLPNVPATKFSRCIASLTAKKLKLLMNLNETAFLADTRKIVADL